MTRSAEKIVSYSNQKEQTDIDSKSVIEGGNESVRERPTCSIQATDWVSNVRKRQSAE